MFVLISQCYLVSTEEKLATEIIRQCTHTN